MITYTNNVKWPNFALMANSNFYSQFICVLDSALTVINKWNDSRVPRVPRRPHGFLTSLLPSSCTAFLQAFNVRSIDFGDVTRRTARSSFRPGPRDPKRLTTWPNTIDHVTRNDWPCSEVHAHRYRHFQFNQKSSLNFPNNFQWRIE